MARWHYNESTDKAGACNASKRPCPLQQEGGPEVPHFHSKAEALEYGSTKAAAEHATIPPAPRRGGSRKAAASAASKEPQDPSTPLEWKGATAPAEGAYLYCSRCQRYFAPASDAEAYINCEQCGNLLGGDPRSVALRFSESKRYASTGDILGAPWYHATNRKNWEECLAEGKFLVHVGSEEAALQRFLCATEFGDASDSGWRLYEVTLPPQLSMAPHLKKDSGAEEFLPRTRGYAITGYVNTQEAAGTISLTVPAGALQVQEVRRLGKRQKDALLRRLQG